MAVTSVFSFFSASRFALVFLAAWLVAVLFFVFSFRSRSNPDFFASSVTGNDLILARINRASLELQSLKHQTFELDSLINSIRSAQPDKIKYTLLEDKIAKASQLEKPALLDKSGESNGNLFNVDSNLWSDAKELKYVHLLTIFKSNLNELRRFVVTHFPRSDNADFELLKEHFSDLFEHFDRLEERDIDWKRKRLIQIKQQIWKAIDKNQNPKDCDSARKLVCVLNKGCGFGCQMHHVAFCLISALATGRTMILDSKNWRYTPKSQLPSEAKNGWEFVFQPLSQTCTDSTGSPRGLWRKDSDDFQVVDMPIIDAIHPSPPFVPLTIPQQIHSDLVKLHFMPHAWFVGQIINYLFRPSASLYEYIEKAKRNFNFVGPVVGIQVRRTDKLGTEASFHKMSEYMQKVCNYFDHLDYINMKNKKPKVERRVYLATDDPSLWTTDVVQWQKKGYTFIGDYSIAQSASLRTRYSINSLKNIILDIVLLSQCDHLVCTFSSQVCRLAFELMQTRETNASNSAPVDFSHAFDSLDDIYYFGGQRPHNQVAVVRHESGKDGEISMEIGDEIGIAGNHWNGYSKGMNKRTKQSGLFPSFKVKDLIEVYPFKAFD